MDAVKVKRAEEVFRLAVDLPAEDRESFLSAQCGADTGLRAFVEQLLSHDATGMDEFMCKPVFAPVHDKGTDVPGRIPQRVGQYEIVRVLGEGGMGVVYEARQAHPQRTVALKVIRSGLPSTSMLRRFQHEAEMLGQLQHPGIACIYEAGVAKIGDEGGILAQQPFFAMELIRGKPLSKHAAENKLGARDCLELIAKVCDAMQHAHGKGVIHRDLKPGNIIVDEAGQPKILDFGVARATDADVLTIATRTSVGQLIGTLPYMSPEQVAGDSRQIDARSDVYALGVILYELLSGRLPHDVCNRPIPEAVRIIRDGEPSRLSSFNTSLRGDIETIVAKACEKEKDRRYQSPAELAADVRRYLRDEPIAARPQSRLYHLGRFAKRNKGLVAGLTATFFALVAGLIGTTWGLLEAADQRDQALASSREAKAVNQFLQEMLASVDPRRTTNPEVTVREILAEAAREIDEGSFKDEPLVEAGLRTTIGSTYAHLGHYAEAEAHLRTGLEIRRRIHGDEHMDVVRSLNDLAEVYHYTAKYAEAESLYLQALAIARRILRDIHPSVAALLDNAGEAPIHGAGLTGADRPHREAPAVQRVRPGDESVEIIWPLHNLVDLRRRMGDYDEAEWLGRQVLAVRRELLGDEHVDVCASLNSLAVVLRQKGDYAGAEPLYREALNLNRKLVGNEHPAVARSLHNLAMLLHHRGDYAEAEPLYREALAIYRKVLDEDHPYTASTLNALGGLFASKGDFDAAEPLYREALAMRRKKLGDNHPKTATSLLNVGWVLHKKGDHAGAEQLYREALAIARRVLPADHPKLASKLGKLGAVLVDQGRYAEAEPLLGECVAIYEKKLPNRSQHYASMSMLACAMGGQGRFEEAEPMLLSGYEGVLNCPNVSESYKRKVLERVVWFYESWGKPDRAAEWRERAPEIDPPAEHRKD